MKKNKNKRPQSCNINTFISNKNKNSHISINCRGNPSGKNYSLKKKYNLKGFSTEDNKNYRINPNSYTDKYKSQVKRFNMYNEMWNKSISDVDYFGISESIKIQPENNKNDSSNGDKFKVNATNT